ncbi:MAG: glycosyltransferase [Candidatus Limnocylindrales bacterium]|jgi:glycosyltransferase involved in cell wall biosynthesis
MPTRPAALLQQFVESGSFDRVIVVNRLRPDRAARTVPTSLRRGSRLVRFGPWLGLATPLAMPEQNTGAEESDNQKAQEATEATQVAKATQVTVIEHSWPYGAMESGLVARLVTEVLASGPTVLWVSDPKSARVLERIESQPTLVTAFDAYDAWDLSPLFRGRRRLSAIRDGYSAAAKGADVVFANTRLMRDRLAAMGASHVVWLPNACPDLSPGTPTAEPYLAYVGRIHERFDTRLALAVADALAGATGRQATFRIAGPVEREPAGWAALARHPAVRLEGPLQATQARAFVAGARAVLIPHTPDEYTRSQDAMKAWDAIAAGVPVVSTSVPPADGWPPGLAIVADDPGSFAAAAMETLAGQLDRSRQARLDHALANRWRDRVDTALDVLAGLRPEV